MNKKNETKQIVGIVIVLSLFAVFLCGCTENSSTNNGVDLSKLLGTWTGNMEFSMFSWRGNASNANISELEFTEDALYMTIKTENETMTIPNSYTVEGDQLILSFQFTGERPDWRPPFNDSERPPFNDSERPPFNDSERPPFDGERPSMKRSYTYSFNEDNTILHLDGSQFKKVI